MPLVEFDLEEGISDTEAVRLIDTPLEKPASKTNQEVSENQQTLYLDMEGPMDADDPFTSRLMTFEVGNISSYKSYNATF